jgi:hypothetical protein
METCTRCKKTLAVSTCKLVLNEDGIIIAGTGGITTTEKKPYAINFDLCFSCAGKIVNFVRNEDDLYLQEVSEVDVHGPGLY